MKVRIAFTVDVDAQAWSDDYGVPLSEVRADVCRYFEQAALAHLAEIGLEAMRDES